MRKVIMDTKIIPSLLLVSILTGCSSIMLGYTMPRAMHTYLLVDEATESFGFKRMKYNIGYNANGLLKGFVKEHELPEMIFEYENEKGRNGIKMYYVKKDIVYVFEYKNWKPTSLYLKESRPLDKYEKLTYEVLMNKAKPKQKGPTVTGSIMNFQPIILNSKLNLLFQSSRWNPQKWLSSWSSYLPSPHIAHLMPNSWLNRHSQLTSSGSCSKPVVLVGDVIGSTLNCQFFGSTEIPCPL